MADRRHRRPAGRRGPQGPHPPTAWRAWRDLFPGPPGLLRRLEHRRFRGRRESPALRRRALRPPRNPPRRQRCCLQRRRCSRPSRCPKSRPTRQSRIRWHQVHQMNRLRRPLRPRLRASLRRRRRFRRPPTAGRRRPRGRRYRSGRRCMGCRRSPENPKPSPPQPRPPPRPQEKGGQQLRAPSGRRSRKLMGKSTHSFRTAGGHCRYIPLRIDRDSPGKSPACYGLVVLWPELGWSITRTNSRPSGVRHCSG